MKIKSAVTFLLITLALAACLPNTSSSPETSNTSITISYLTNSSELENVVTVINTGSAATKNLKLWICPLQTSRNQQNDQSIDSYLIEPIVLPLEFTREYQYNTDCLSNSANGKAPNGLLFSFKPLEPNQEIKITIKALSKVEQEEREYAGKVFVKIPTNVRFGKTAPEITSHLSEPLMDYFSWIVSIADLYIKAECENCTIKGNQVVYGFTPFFEFDFFDFEMQPSSSSFIHMSSRFQVKYHYYDLKHTNILPEDAVVYLMVTQDNGLGINTLVPVSREQFESDLP